jgi:GntR family transcriptional regulator
MRRLGKTGKVSFGAMCVAVSIPEFSIFRARPMETEENNMDWNMLRIEWKDDAPVYLQLSNYFSERISAGELREGDALPTETALCRVLGISRSTVRQAFSMLEDEGVIVRKKRVGTRVCKPKLKRNINNLYNFTTEMHLFGLTPSSKVISFTTVHPPARIAETLNLKAADTAFRIERLRLANNEPLLLETAYIPTRVCPTLSRDQLNDSLYATILECTGSSPQEATEVYEAVTLNKREAQLLNVHAGDAAFRTLRVSKNTAGEIFEYCVELARGDRNKFQIVLKNSGIHYSRVL